jgi:hypothetical protein
VAAKAKIEKKHKLVMYKGGLCQDPDCKYPGPLPDCCYDFDHREPSEKSFSISAGSGKSLVELMIEVDKCDLVCSNCHRIRTAGNPDIAKKLSAANTGKKRTAETRAKMSAASKGRIPSPEAIERMSAAHKGQKQSPETRAKRSVSMMGNTYRADFLKKSAAETPTHLIN